MLKRNETNKEKMKRRADLLYPSMNEKKENSRVEASNNIVRKNDKEKPNNNPKTRKISDKVLDLFFPSMKIETKKDINENKKVNSKNKEHEIINNVKYPKKTDSKEVELLKEKAKKETKEIEKERWKEHAKNFGGATLEIGSATIPVGGNIKAASSVVKALTPKLGRKVSEAIVKQGTQGAVTGSVFGIGESLMENKNLIKTVGKDAAIGTITGASSAGIIGKIKKNIEVKKVEKLITKRNDWGIAFQKASRKPEQAIEILLEKKQGFVPGAINKKGIGEIDFVWGDSNGGLKHIIERRNKQGYDGISYAKKIPDMIKNGKIIEKPNQPGRKFIINENTETVIRLDWNSKETKWLVTSYYQL